jgi:formyl-CoA transferase
VPQRFGNGAPSVSPSNVFRCRDGHIIMVAGNDAQFRKLCGVLGEPTLASDPRYLTNALRVTNRDALMTDLNRLFGAQTKAHWLQVLAQSDLVAGPINDMADVFAESQIQARGLVTQALHGSGGTVPILTSPMRLSGTPLDRYTAPPRSGEHTLEVLTSLLGMSPDEIQALMVSPSDGAAAP